jgi:polyhydroxyalkanoic acid synthase PhaR subunit
MSQKSDEHEAFDPFGAWKNMRDSGMEAWSKMMIQLVNTEAYAQASATMLDTWLASSAPFRKALESTMTQALTQLNMPTRSDVISVAERLTHIEMRLDDLEAKLDERQQATPKPAAGKAKETAA